MHSHSLFRLPILSHLLCSFCSFFPGPFQRQKRTPHPSVRNPATLGVEPFHAPVAGGWNNIYIYIYFSNRKKIGQVDWSSFRTLRCTALAGCGLRFRRFFCSLLGGWLSVLSESGRLVCCQSIARTEPLDTGNPLPAGSTLRHYCCQKTSDRWKLFDCLRFFLFWVRINNLRYPKSIAEFVVLSHPSLHSIPHTNRNYKIVCFPSSAVRLFLFCSEKN